MTNTRAVRVEVPHQLGRDEARARVEKGVGKMADMLPGATVSAAEWTGDTVQFVLGVMGQQVTTRLAVEEARVIAELDLPPMLALFAGKIRDKLARGAPKLLE
ncbi:MAG: polyhydroxyalkanoic acid system family protein [Pseudomonadota bacterium]